MAALAAWDLSRHGAKNSRLNLFGVLPPARWGGSLDVHATWLARGSSSSRLPLQLAFGMSSRHLLVIECQGRRCNHLARDNAGMFEYR